MNSKKSSKNRETVIIEIPYIEGGDTGDKYFSCNDYECLVPVGIPVTVPKCIAAIYENAKAALRSKREQEMLARKKARQLMDRL